MKLTLQKAEESRLAEYLEIFRGSEIYERYFRGGSRLENTMRDAMRTGELYAAVTGEGEAAGVMRVAPRGFCGLYPYLGLLGVGQSFRGRGVGSFLMDRLEEMARQSGAKRVTLMVSDFNTGARAFYRRRGYRRLGTLADAVKPGIAELVMVLDLPAEAPRSAEGNSR